MFNSGFIKSTIDGSEFKYDLIDEGLPKEYSYKKNLPIVLDQGQYPICVPCSISALLEYKLSLKSGIKKTSNFELFDIYNSKTTYGEGMTCKEAFDYVIKNGAAYHNGNIKLSKYFIINNIISLRHAIYNNGPCVLVLPVYDTSVNEFWKRSGKCEGYHAVSVVGYDENGFIIRNSWGDTYGYDGYAYITNRDINAAIEIWTLI